MDDSGTAQSGSGNRGDPAAGFKVDTLSLPEAFELQAVGKDATAPFISDTEYEEDENEKEPSEHEKRSLRHVGESLPYAAWLVAFVELCERYLSLKKQRCRHGAAIRPRLLLRN